MANEVNMSAVEAALSKREEYILSNLQTLGMKSMRRLMEKDLGLPEKALDCQKGAVNSLVDKMVESWLKCKKISTNGSKDNGYSVEVPPADPSSKPPSKSSKKASSCASKRSGKPKEGSKEQRSKRGNDTMEGSKHRLAKKARLAEGTAGNGSHNGAVRASASGPIQSQRIKKLKQLLKDATIRFGPSLYTKNKDEGSLAAALEALLSTHGLGIESTPREVQRVRSKLQLERDLEGIDTSNIIEGGSRRRSALRPQNRASAVQAKPPHSEGDGSSSGDDSEDGFQFMSAKRKVVIDDEEKYSDGTVGSASDDGEDGNDSEEEIVPSPAVLRQQLGPADTSDDELPDAGGEGSGGDGRKHEGGQEEGADGVGAISEDDDYE